DFPGARRGVRCKAMTILPFRVQESAATWPFVSVVVPVRNEAAFIRDTLLQLLTQDYPADRFEVLVADGRSTDATRAVVAELQTRWPNLRLLDNPRLWSSAGRNAATTARVASVERPSAT